MAVNCWESQQSNAEGAELCAQPKEAGPGARWLSTAGKASSPMQKALSAVPQPKETGPGAGWPSTAGKACRPMQKALSPVPSLRRRGQGLDGCRLWGKLAVQCLQEICQKVP